MDSIYDPPDERSVLEWFDEIGERSGNEAPWKIFGPAILQTCAATDIGLLKAARDADVDSALNQSMLSIGYKNALCKYLVPQGSSRPWEFAVPKKDPKVARDKDKGLSQKRFESQRARPPLGREIGPEALQALTLPSNLFQTIKCGKEVVMKPKGPNSCERVADLIYGWVVATYGTVHVDMPFCERMEELLNKEWPKLKPWNGQPRRWSAIVKNRFTNAREAKEGAYTKLFKSIPEVDLSSPARRLIKDGLPIVGDSTKRSMFQLSPDKVPNSAGEASDSPGLEMDPAEGVPVVVGGIAVVGPLHTPAAVPAATPAATPAVAPAAAPAAARAAARAAVPAGARATGKTMRPPQVGDGDSSDEEGAHLTPEECAAEKQKRKEALLARQQKRKSEKSSAAAECKDKPHPVASQPATNGSLESDGSNEPALKKPRGKRQKPAPPVFESSTELAASFQRLSDEEVKALRPEESTWPSDLKVAKVFPYEDGSFEWHIGAPNQKVLPIYVSIMLTYKHN